MNELQTKEVQTISSKEVAKMMEMDHGKLLRKIDGINEDFNQAKIGLVKYWIESTYVDKKVKKEDVFKLQN